MLCVVGFLNDWLYRNALAVAVACRHVIPHDFSESDRPKFITLSFLNWSNVYEVYVSVEVSLSFCRMCLDQITAA
jgi:hypothetical protein